MMGFLRFLLLHLQSADVLSFYAAVDTLIAVVHTLPEGWRLLYEPSGRPYFVDDRTKNTTYHDPRRAASQSALNFDVVRS